MLLEPTGTENANTLTASFKNQVKHLKNDFFVKPV